MSFAGHVLDMISRMKSNESFKKARHDRYNKTREAYRNVVSVSHKLKEKKSTKEELHQIKQEIRLKLQKEYRKSIIKTIVIFLLIVLMLGLMFSLFACKK